MKNTIKQLLLLLFLSLIFLPHTYADEDIKTEVFNVSKGGTIDIDIRLGDVTIDVWNKDQVKIQYEDDPDVRGSLKIEQSGNRVIVRSNGWDNADIKVTIPDRFNIKVQTTAGDVEVRGSVTGQCNLATGGGNVRIQNINGETNVSTAGGDIDAGDVKGNAKLATAGGDIVVNLITGSASVATAGGDITIKKAGLRLKLNTAGGNVYVGGADGNVTIQTAGGDIKAEKVNGDVRLMTGGGNVTLKGAAGSVAAKSGGGDLELRSVSGKVDAATGSGTIYLEMLSAGNGNSEIKTGSGDIKLVLAPDINVTVIARIKAADWMPGEKKEYENLKSDFRATEIKRIKGNREIEAVYKINNGGKTIELNVSYGNIEIRKLR